MIVLILVRPAWGADVAASANILAAGGVGVAAGQDNVAISLNPGAIALHERYDFAGWFAYGPYKGLGWGGSAVDASTSPHLAAGFAYSGSRTNPPLTPNDLPGWKEPGQALDNIRHDHDFTGALAVPFLKRRISAGVGVDVTLYDHNRLGKGTSVDGHAGVAVRPIDALELGVSARNVLSLGDPADRPLELRGGARVFGDKIGWVEVDGGWRDAELGPTALLAAGGELRSGHGRFRAGYHLEGGVSALSAGLGWEDEDGAIEYGISVPIGSGASTGAVIQEVSVRFGAPPPVDSR